MENIGFVKEHFEFIVLLAAIVGAFMINRSDLNAIQQEMKDFHGRLCVLEEKHQQVMQDLAEKHQRIMQEQAEIRTLMYQSLLEKHHE